MRVKQGGRLRKNCWRKWFAFLSLNLIITHASATSDDIEALNRGDTSSLPSAGNFALPAPQQLGPLLSFGQNLIGKNNLQLYLSSFSPYHIPNVGPFKNVSSSLIFGLTDNTSIFLNYPISADSNPRKIHRSNLQDLTLQLEQAIYTAGTNKVQEQATIVGSLTVPLESPHFSLDPTSFGSSTYFLGLTYNRTTVDWLFFLSPGYHFSSEAKSYRFGAQTLYQAGVGLPLLWNSEQSILSVLFEIDGQYSEKNRVNHRILPNTGGNVISLTPSLLFATKHTITQVGVGYPVVQHLFGHQNTTKYFIAAQIALTIP